ncbi:MAG TPA: sigma factor [Acidimicrobiales bacterium]|nr:sigma factor [Acidimicrobiales bacterium]
MGGESSAADRGHVNADSGTKTSAGARGADDVAGWLSRAARGDQNAWASLVDRFAPTIWAVTRAEGTDPVVSSEAAQTTWLRLADRLGQNPDHSRFETWLIETARREAQRSSLLRGLSATSA